MSLQVKSKYKKIKKLNISAEIRYGSAYVFFQDIQVMAEKKTGIQSGIEDLSFNQNHTVFSRFRLCVCLRLLLNLQLGLDRFLFSILSKACSG